jgi:uncharacterized protein (TIGR00251 family)
MYPCATTAWFRWQETGLMLEITTQPGAAKRQFVGLHGGRLKIRIKAPPVDGKANAALIEYLAEEFSVTRSQICIVRGATSRSKTLLVSQPRVLPESLLLLGLTPR